MKTFPRSCLKAPPSLHATLQQLTVADDTDSDFPTHDPFPLWFDRYGEEFAKCGNTLKK